MSLYVLDTDIMTLYQYGHPRVAQHVLARPVAQLAIAVISVEEELTGWYTKLRRVRKRDQLACLPAHGGRRTFLRAFSNPVVHRTWHHPLRKLARRSSPRRQERL